MMRGSTVLWVVLAGVLGIGLFGLKYEVQALEDRLASVNHQIRSGQETIHILKAEWSFLNDPNRLRELAERHLAMRPVLPNQLSHVAALPV
ncbi:MAG: energy transducer TonB, partial [Alphaproteobacteria bacterium]|nr:energy transducer TonB [Alphaproteobacteria bacterium]